MFTRRFSAQGEMRRNFGAKIKPLHISYTKTCAVPEANKKNPN